jgi:hypothetical protein
MPSESGRQHRFFEWIDHTPGAAKSSGVPRSVAHEFVKADEAAHKHFREKSHPGGSDWHGTREGHHGKESME